MIMMMVLIISSDSVHIINKAQAALSSAYVVTTSTLPNFDLMIIA